MRIRNENVNCYTCKYNLPPANKEQKKERLKACKKCTTRNGYAGWEPGPDVLVQETKGWTFTAAGKPVETLFRKVKV